MFWYLPFTKRGCMRFLVASGTGVMGIFLTGSGLVFLGVSGGIFSFDSDMATTLAMENIFSQTS